MYQQNPDQPTQAVGTTNNAPQRVEAPARERSESTAAELKENRQSPALEQREKAQNTNPLEALKTLAANEGIQSTLPATLTPAQKEVNQLLGIKAYSAFE